MKFQFDTISSEKLNELQNNVNQNSEQLDKIVDDIIQPYCKSLDEYVQFISDCLANGEIPPTDGELEDYCINLSTRIYFAGGLCERLGIRDDIAKAVYKRCIIQVAPVLKKVQ